MHTEHSVVIVETADHQMADITLIVHSDDPVAAERWHFLCREAVRQAVHHVDTQQAPTISTSHQAGPITPGRVA